MSFLRALVSVGCTILLHATVHNTCEATIEGWSLTTTTISNYSRRGREILFRERLGLHSILPMVCTCLAAVVSQQLKTISACRLHFLLLQFLPILLE